MLRSMAIASSAVISGLPSRSRVDNALWLIEPRHSLRARANARTEP